MKTLASYSLLATTALLVFFGCGNTEVQFFVSFSGGSSVLFVHITDAMPVLPSGTEEVLITFKEVQVHKEGGDWIPLPLARTPYTVDLLQFHSGKTTELIQPVRLEPGMYDQIRLLIDHGFVLIHGEAHSIEVPSGQLMIERDFLFDLRDGSVVDLTIDFDLSQSLRVAGPPLVPSYKLHPVLHINHSEEAAAIHGEIATATFDDHGSSEAIVTVIMDKDFSGDVTAADEEYTRIKVGRDSPQFTIFWLVPEKGYTVTVELDGKPPAEFEQFVLSADLPKGEVFVLNHSNPV